MTNEEIREFLLKDPDGQNLFADLTKGLRSTKDDILAEKRKLRSEFDLLHEKYSSLENSWLQEQQERKEKALETGVLNAFSSARIDPNSYDDVRALLENKGGISLSEETGTISIGDTPIDEYLKDWQKSETGKRFTLANYNTGGGARGSGSSYGSAPINLQNMTSSEILNAVRNGRIK